MKELSLYYIKPPISPWDKKYEDEILLDNAKQTLSDTPAGSWAKCARCSIKDEDYSKRVQHWFDRGYRLGECKLSIK